MHIMKVYFDNFVFGNFTEQDHISTILDLVFDTFTILAHNSEFKALK